MKTSTRPRSQYAKPSEVLDQRMREYDHYENLLLSLRKLVNDEIRAARKRREFKG